MRSGQTSSRLNTTFATGQPYRVEAISTIERLFGVEAGGRDAARTRSQDGCAT